MALEDLCKEISWITERFARAVIDFGLQKALARAVSLGMHVQKTPNGFLVFEERREPGQP